MAKSQMSIISCTSPWPSARILPISSDDEIAQRLLQLAQRVAEIAHDLAALGRGHLAPGRGRRLAAAAATWSYAAGLASLTRAIGSPVVGLNEVSSCASASSIQLGPVQAPGLMRVQGELAEQGGNGCGGHD